MSWELPRSTARLTFSVTNQSDTSNLSLTASRGNSTSQRSFRAVYQQSLAINRPLEWVRTVFLCRANTSSTIVAQTRTRCQTKSPSKRRHFGRAGTTGPYVQRHIYRRTTGALRILRLLVRGVRFTLLGAVQMSCAPAAMSSRVLNPETIAFFQSQRASIVTIFQRLSYRSQFGTNRPPYPG